MTTIIYYYTVIGAQLTSPSEPVCPGNRVIFTCQQPGALTVWMIYLPSSRTLQNIVQNPRYGSVWTFAADPGFDFEIHVVSNSSNSITTELQVTAVREIDGATVECFGANGTIMSTLRVASVGE